MSKEGFLYYQIEERKAKEVTLLKTKDEAGIWNDFLSGDDSALSYIYRCYANSLFNYGKQFADTEVVQDCIQDLFYDLIKSRKKLAKGVSIKAYLFSSLRRKIVRQLKEASYEIRENKLDNKTKFRISIASDHTTPFDNFTTRRLEILKNTCNSLPPKQREAILLFYFEKLSYNEIADIFGMSKVSSARILIYRALDSLKRMLGNTKGDLLAFYLSLFCLNILLHLCP